MDTDERRDARSVVDDIEAVESDVRFELGGDGDNGEDSEDGEDTEEGFEKVNEGAPDPGAVDARFPLNIVKAERSIFELHRQWKNGRLRLSPDYQREFVWKVDKQILLVESVLARIPLPVFYLSEETEDELLVVDGQQRLTTLFSFMEGWYPDKSHPSVIHTQPGVGARSFQLKGLKLMPEVNGKTFDTLSAKEQRRFEDGPLSLFIIQKGTPESAKYELFGRLNQGAVPLNFQEMRNALFSGSGLDLVRELAAEGCRFREVAGAHRKYNRRRADELVLRGLSFLWKGWKESGYRGDLQVFLNDCLTELNHCSDAELESLRERFLRALDHVQGVFGDRAFQRFDKEREEFAGHVSGPLVEVEISVFGRLLDGIALTEARAERIRVGFEEICRDGAFQDAVLKATQTKRNLEHRMRHFEEMVRDATQPEP